MDLRAARVFARRLFLAALELCFTNAAFGFSPGRRGSSGLVGLWFSSPFVEWQKALAPPHASPSAVRSAQPFWRSGEHFAEESASPLFSSSLEDGFWEAQDDSPEERERRLKLLGSWINSSNPTFESLEKLVQQQKSALPSPKGGEGGASSAKSFAEKGLFPLPGVSHSPKMGIPPAPETPPQTPPVFLQPLFAKALQLPSKKPRLPPNFHFPGDMSGCPVKKPQKNPQETPKDLPDFSSEEWRKIVEEMDAEAAANAEEIQKTLAEEAAKMETWRAQPLSEELINGVSGEDLGLLCACKGLPRSGTDEERRDRLRAALARGFQPSPPNPDRLKQYEEAKKLLETPPKRDLQSLYERARARSIVAEAQHDPGRFFQLDFRKPPEENIDLSEISKVATEAEEGEDNFFQFLNSRLNKVLWTADDILHLQELFARNARDEMLKLQQERIREESERAQLSRAVDSIPKTFPIDGEGNYVPGPSINIHNSFSEMSVDEKKEAFLRSKKGGYLSQSIASLAEEFDVPVDLIGDFLCRAGASAPLPLDCPVGSLVKASAVWNLVEFLSVADVASPDLIYPIQKARDLAEEYGVTEAELKEVCRELGIQ